MANNLTGFKDPEGYDVSDKYVALNDLFAATRIEGTFTQILRAEGGDYPSSGSIYSWGSGTNGALGSGAITHRSSPVQITGVNNNNNWKKTYGGGDLGSAYAIRTNDTLWVWGYNTAGQLGTNNLTLYSSPVQVGSLTNWWYVSPGSDHALFLKTNYEMWSVGNNNNGKLGDNTVVQKSSPVQIGSSNDWIDVGATGSSSFAIKINGTLWSWGHNGYGTLGDSTNNHRSSPVQVGSLSEWKYITGASNSVAALKVTGTLWTWGRNESGQLGDGTTIDKSSPIQIGSLNTWKKIKGGDTYFVSIKKDGSLWGWGGNPDGVLGDGTVISKSSPLQIGALYNWTSVEGATVVGAAHVVAIKSNGTLWTWGNNSQGQLGDSSITHRSSPIQVGAQTAWKSASVTYRTTYGLN